MSEFKRKKKTHKWGEVKRERLSSEDIERIEAAAEMKVLELTLAELRQELGLTQEQVAKELAVAQSQLSRLERRRNPQLSTLERYVEALGGHLELVAVVGGKRIAIKSNPPSTSHTNPSSSSSLNPP